MQSESFRLTRAAADKYQNNSVPAMFGPLARATLAKIILAPDLDVIDIACGTGALTREIASALPGKGRVVGVDLNATMIDVAREQQPATLHRIEWQACDVCAIPYPDSSFDLAFIQQGLQFFPDKPAALAEIRRVLKPGGWLYLTCWRAISAFNGSLAEALEQHLGPEAAEKARAPFSFRDGALIERLLVEAGFDVAPRDAVILERRFPDLAAQILALPVEADLRAAGDKTTEAVIAEVARKLTPYDRGDEFVMPQEAHLFLAHRKR